MNKLQHHEYNTRPVFSSSEKTGDEYVSETDLSVNNKKKLVAGKQSNHGGFHLPCCLSHLKNPTFYMALAWWGLLKGSAFTRTDVAEAFRVTPRRAADMMSYLVNSCQDVVHLEVRTERVASGLRMRFVTVLAVAQAMPPRPPRPSTPPPKKVSRRRDNSPEMTEARNLFLGVGGRLRNTGGG